MNLSDILPAGAMDALSTQFGIPREQAQRAAEALLPSIVGGMGDAAGGLGAPVAGDLEAHLNGLGGGELADNVTGPQQTDVNKGNDILGKIFGSKDVSRQVADQAALNTGLDTPLLKRMLPILAMLVAGYMTKQAQNQQGGLGGVLGNILGGLAGVNGGSAASAAGQSGIGGLGGILASVLKRS